MIKQTKFTRLAKGKPCMLRIPGICTMIPSDEGGWANTMLCHAPCVDKCFSKKGPDEWGAVGCYPCHQQMDKISKEDAAAVWMPAIYEWQQLLFEVGYLEKV